MDGHQELIAEVRELLAMVQAFGIDDRDTRLRASRVLDAARRLGDQSIAIEIKEAARHILAERNFPSACRKALVARQSVFCAGELRHILDECGRTDEFYSAKEILNRLGVPASRRSAAEKFLQRLGKVKGTKGTHYRSVEKSGPRSHTIEYSLAFARLSLKDYLPKSKDNSVR